MRFLLVIRLLGAFGDGASPKDQGTPIPQIVAKLTIKTCYAGEAPSVASLYRALADARAQPPATHP